MSNKVGIYSVHLQYITQSVFFRAVSDKILTLHSIMLSARGSPLASYSIAVPHFDGQSRTEGSPPLRCKMCHAFNQVHFFVFLGVMNTMGSIPGNILLNFLQMYIHVLYLKLTC